MEQKTLIHEVRGSSPASGVSAPQIRVLDESASGICQAKSPTIVGLAPREVPQGRLGGKASILSWCFCWWNVSQASSCSCLIKRGPRGVRREVVDIIIWFEWLTCVALPQMKSIVWYVCSLIFLPYPGEIFKRERDPAVIKEVESVHRKVRHYGVKFFEWH